MFNMGVNGLFATYFVLAVGGELNGPTICGIFTIVGFGATGKHLRNIAPVMMGVYLASFTKTWNIYQPSPMLALLFSTTLAPVAGEFGVVAGIVAGYLHSSVALNVGIVYGGMNLYNNGYVQAESWPYSWFLSSIPSWTGGQGQEADCRCRSPGM